jgi:Secretion system C-terminal sorting domain
MIKKLYSLIFLLFIGFGAFAQPALPASSPTKPESDVISLFSDSYTNVAGTDWFPNWGQTTVVSDIAIFGNNIKVYTNTNYEGTQFASPINASSMTNLHMDIWTANCNAFDVFLINPGPVEQKVTLIPNNTGWNSFDILLSQYNIIALNNIIQFKFVATPAGSNLYIDNIYFWKPANLPTITGFTVPAKIIGDPNFTLTPPTSNSTGAFTYLSSNTSVATISGSTVTITGIGTSIITANQAAAGAYSAGSITTTLTVTPAAAPTPTVAAANVISLFSNAYTNVPVDTWRTGWSPATVTFSDLQIAGNDTKLYTNLSYVGVEFTGSNLIDATAMQYYHVDVWTPNATEFKVKLVDIGANGAFGGGDDVEHEYTMPSLTQGGWNSYNIPLSAFTALTTRAHLAQMIFVGIPFGSTTAYIDNVYFYNVPNAPTLSNFTIPAQTVGAAPFSITAPTSNSTGAFTYTSSNTNVATIAGNTITVVGAGTSTITASQAAAGGFGTGIITAPFVVNVAPIMMPAPTPLALTTNVLSLYSNAYANVTGIDWYPNWGQPIPVIITDTTLQGNDTRKYANLSYQGVQFATPLNVSTYDKLHIDIWTPNCSSFQVFLINTFPSSPAVEQSITLTPTLGGWNSYNIDLAASFRSPTTVIDLTNVGQMKFVATPFGSSIIYTDNIYFYKNSVLPVSLTNFTATKNKNITNINWNTLSETGNKGFEVESSVDGRNFTSLAFVPSQGNSKNNYAIIDKAPKVGINYYRLKQIDMDGRFIYSSIATVKFEKNDVTNFSFFPNPAKDILKINIGVIENENATIKLMNTLGQTLILKTINKSASSSLIRFDISTMASGVYYLEVKNGTNNSVEKVVIN